MQKALILTIPEHIAALPEEEQGPALVEEIHRRKELSNAWEYYASIPVGYDPFKATRAVLGIDPAGEGAVWFRVGGRGHGKTVRMQNIETMTRQMWECLPWHDPHQEVRDLVRKSGTTPEPQTIPAVESARWVCASPTGHASRSPLEERWVQYTRDMVDGLAGRPHNRKLNAKMQAIYDILGVRQHDTDD